jgi:hypothetical protein
MYLAEKYFDGEKIITDPRLQIRIPIREKEYA